MLAYPGPFSVSLGLSVNLFASSCFFSYTFLPYESIVASVHMAIDQSFWESGAVINLDQRSVLIAYGLQDFKATKEELDSFKPAFYYPDFFLKAERPWIQFSSWSILSLEELAQELASASADQSEWTIGHQELFKHAFEGLQEAFESQRLIKVVPYTFAYSSSKMSSERLKFCLKKALHRIENYPVWLYGYWNKSKGVIGITPETLFSHHEQRPTLVQTMALAGTKKQGCEADFEGNKKENAEHELVVADICQVLSSFGRVEVEEKRLLPLPALTHLLTPIQVDLKEPFDFEKLVCALHPTPALGAFPRKEGWEWLCLYQARLDRSYFGAPVGFSFPERGVTVCYVSIRHVQWCEEGMRIGAGCGVVKESECNQEWEEICLKLQAVRSVFAL